MPTRGAIFGPTHSRSTTFSICSSSRAKSCYRALSEALIEQVHGTLGRHRADDPRTGWLSGLPEQDGALHPTRGGLRIGKPLPERRLDEVLDERLEWDREGQYFRYLTKWMDALSRASIILDQPRYHRHAVDLAEAVFPRSCSARRLEFPWASLGR